MTDLLGKLDGFIKMHGGEVDTSNKLDELNQEHSEEIKREFSIYMQELRLNKIEKLAMRIYVQHADLSVLISLNAATEFVDFATQWRKEQEL